MPDFFRKTTFGHGSYGYECVICGATDYSGELEHEEGCLYAPIVLQIQRILRQRDFAMYHLELIAAGDSSPAEQAEQALYDLRKGNIEGYL